MVPTLKETLAPSTFPSSMAAGVSPPPPPPPKPRPPPPPPVPVRLPPFCLRVKTLLAPVRSNMHAILRQKTLLGETYVQLIPEAPNAPFLRDGGQLADSQVEPSVTLDGILSAFDPKTRLAFQVWQQAVAEGINGRGEQINADFATLEPFVEHANSLVGVLASQEGAVRALVHNTGVVFDALASRDHQLEGLIVNGERGLH